jgi:hypothetical protein
MRPPYTYSITRPSTHIYFNDALSEMSTSKPARQAARCPALLGLALGIGLAVSMMLNAWLSLSPQTTDTATRFAAHSKAQTLSADALEDLGIPPVFLDDIFTHF